MTMTIVATIMNGMIYGRLLVKMPIMNSARVVPMSPATVNDSSN